jgi:hypothetical protein
LYPQLNSSQALNFFARSIFLSSFFWWPDIFLILEEKVTSPISVSLSWEHHQNSNYLTAVSAQQQKDP